MSIDRVAIDDNILIKGKVSTAGSGILGGFVPPFGSPIAEALAEAGAKTVLSVKPNEFGVGLTGGFGCIDAVAFGEADAGIGCDVNGSIRKEAARRGISFIKPTYGTVSRYGLVSTAPSMEQIGVAYRSVSDGFAALSAIAGRDFPAAEGGAKNLRIGTQSCLAEELIEHASSAAYIISAAETSGSIARFDGVKFGRRAEGCASVEEIYERTRTEFLTFETKIFAMLGVFALSEENRRDLFEKSLKVRRLINDAVDSAFEVHDAIMTPVRVAEDYHGAFRNLSLLALPNLTGRPVMSTPDGVQYMARRGGEGVLRAIAEALESGEEGVK